MYIIDDILNAIGAQKAADVQAKAAQQGIDLQRDIYGQQRQDQMPWLMAGQKSLADLATLQNDPNSINQSAAYQFRMQQGQQALERSAAARGGLMGGGFMKGLDRYSQGLASDEYGNQWNRLMGIAQMGQGSAQNLGSMGSHYADSSSNLYGALGNANSAGIAGTYSNAAGAVRSLGNMIVTAATGQNMMGQGASSGLLGMGGGGGGFGGGGGSNLASMGQMGQSTGYIPTQGFSGLGQLSLGGMGGG